MKKSFGTARIVLVFFTLALVAACSSQETTFAHLREYIDSVSPPVPTDASPLELANRLKPLYQQENASIPFLVKKVTSSNSQESLTAIIALEPLLQSFLATPSVEHRRLLELMGTNHLVKALENINTNSMSGNWIEWYDGTQQLIARHLSNASETRGQAGRDVLRSFMQLRN